MKKALGGANTACWL